jgi:hypothetical protein
VTANKTEPRDCPQQGCAADLQYEESIGPSSTDNHGDRQKLGRFDFYICPRCGKRSLWSERHSRLFTEV